MRRSCQLDLADPGTEVDEETVTQGEGDGVTNADGTPKESDAEKAKREKAEAEAAAKAAKEAEEDDEPETEDPGEEADAEGMGFPRVKGKTVDIFDGKTPHEAVRLVDGVAVPLSQKNYETKTDAEVADRLNVLRKKGKTRL